MVKIKGYETVGKYELDEVLPYVSDDGSFFKKQYGDYNVKLCSVRLVTFKRNHVCVCCDLPGSKMLLQKGHGQSSPHFNMYAISSGGRYILMTKDHIVAKSNGGSDHIDNMQTMCANCNEFKGSMSVNLKQLKHIMSVYRSDAKKIDKANTIINYLNKNNIEIKGDRVSKLVKYKEKYDANQERMRTSGEEDSGSCNQVAQ